MLWVVKLPCLRGWCGWRMWRGALCRSVSLPVGEPDWNATPTGNGPVYPALTESAETRVVAVVDVFICRSAVDRVAKFPRPVVAPVACRSCVGAMERPSGPASGFPRPWLPGGPGVARYGNSRCRVAAGVRGRWRAASLVVRMLCVLREFAAGAALPLTACPEPVVGSEVRPEGEYASPTAGTHLLLVVAGVVGAASLRSFGCAVLIHQGVSGLAGRAAWRHVSARWIVRAPQAVAGLGTHQVSAPAGRAAWLSWPSSRTSGAIWSNSLMNGDGRFGSATR